MRSHGYGRTSPELLMGPRRHFPPSRRMVCVGGPCSDGWGQPAEASHGWCVPQPVAADVNAQQEGQRNGTKLHPELFRIETTYPARPKTNRGRSFVKNPLHWHAWEPPRPGVSLARGRGQHHSPVHQLSKTGTEQLVNHLLPPPPRLSLNERARGGCMLASMRCCCSSLSVGSTTRHRTEFACDPFSLCLNLLGAFVQPRPLTASDTPTPGESLGRWLPILVPGVEFGPSPHPQVPSTDRTCSTPRKHLLESGGTPKDFRSRCIFIDIQSGCWILLLRVSNKK